MRIEKGNAGGDVNEVFNLCGLNHILRSVILADTNFSDLNGYCLAGCLLADYYGLTKY